MSDVGQVAGAVKSIGDLVGDILSRADRDALLNEKNELTTKLQKNFLSPDLDSDSSRAFIGGLCKSAGRPIPPSGNPDEAWRLLVHTFSLIAIDLIHERQLVARLLKERIK